MFRTRRQLTNKTNRDISLGSSSPFIGHNIPCIGRTLPQKQPLVGNYAPFVRDQGFTLIELMVTLAILAIVGSFALPAFRDTILNMRIRSDTNDLVGTLQVARSESIKRKSPITICGKTLGSTTCNVAPNWSTGWIMWVDSNADGIVDAGEEVLRQHDGLQSGVTVVTFAAIAQFAYLPDGSSNAPVNTEFRICDNNRTGERGRKIEIGFTGRTKTDIYKCV